VTADSQAPAWLDREEYPFRNRGVQLADGRMHYVDEGAGDPILFVHGTPTWSFDYRHLITAMSRRRRAIAIDHFGFGLSDRPADFAYTPEAHAGALRQFVDALDLRNLTLVVHDFGGPIALPLALDHRDRVARVVVINSWMWPFEDPDMLRKARIAGSTFGRWLYKHLNVSLRVLMPQAYGNKAALTREIHRQYLAVFREKSARVQVLHTLARALTASRGHYAGLLARVERLRQLPVLVIWGMKDSAFGPHMLERWRALLPGASVVRLADAGHWPHDEQPAAVERAINEWLEPAKGPK
jgi:haloalkane dehalogenase